MLVLYDMRDRWRWLCDRQAVRACEKSGGVLKCEAVLAGGEGRVASLGEMLGRWAARWARRQLACTWAALWAWGRAGGALGSWGSAFRILPDREGDVHF